MFFSARKKDVVESSPLFDADQISCMMVEARERVRVKSASYLGLWSWGRLFYGDFFAAISQAKEEYHHSFIAQDGPMCLKWIYIIERNSMQVIEKYKATKNLT